MSTRLLDLKPSEMINLSKQELLDGIRSSEGRTVASYVCPLAPNYVDKVSNAELVSSFGTDLITLEGYDPRNLQLPGLPSKNKKDDKESLENLQIELGKGYSISEIKKITGRPIGVILLVPREGEVFGGIYAKSVYSKDMMEYLVEEGYDYICLVGYGQDTLIEAVKEASKLFGDRVVLEAGIPHGTGKIENGTYPPYNLRDLVDVSFVKKLASSGADIVDIPAAGIIPGYTIEYVSKLIDAIHSENSIAASCIAHSIEGSSKEVLERVLIDNKTAGIDMFNIAAGGVYESVPLPEDLFNSCVAIKGKRHTYRRMSQSNLR